MATDHITRDAVRNVLHWHPGIRANEVAKLLKISVSSAEKHIRDIRAEWKGKE